LLQKRILMDYNALSLHDTVLTDADPLTLELEDDDFIQVIDSNISDSLTYYANKHLPQRQAKLLRYYMGDQFDASTMMDGTIPYVENVVYESVMRIKPIASSRLPDLTVKPGSTDPSSIESAKTLTDVFNTDMNRREMRKLLGLAHVHEQLFLYFVLKARWNTELGSDGDKEFINVYPTNIVWDHTCKTNNADDMRFIAEFAEITLKEICMMFPKKAKEFLEYLGILEDDVKRQEKMASLYKICEVWFHWYKDTTVFGETKWEKINGVVWKYGTFVLGKMRNPYFDYEGKTHLFSKEMKEKGQPSQEELYQLLFGAMSKTDTVYYNYFKNPRKPYFFGVYESLGQDPIDATNRAEQILYFQDHINLEGTQIIQMNEQSSGKLMVNSDAIDKSVLKTIDFHNTKQAISVNGDDITKAYGVISMPAAPSQLYQSKSENRSTAFEMMGVGNTSRGVQQGDQTLGEAQMFKEADYGFIDDLVEGTINEAAEWIAQWSMQFIRVFYTKEHLVDAAGKDGESLYLALTQDIVEDGMVAVVSASGVDKMMRKSLAVKNMELGVGDILSYYEDTEQSNPRERAKRAFLQKAAPMQYYQQYLADQGQGPVPGPVQPGQGMPSDPDQPDKNAPQPDQVPDMQMAPASQGDLGATGPIV